MSKKSSRAVIDRIKQVFSIENKAGSDSRLCEVLGLSKQTLSSWLSRDSVPYALCIQIAEDKNVSLDWLLAGKEAAPIFAGVTEVKDGYKVALPPRQQAALDLFNALPEEKQREILGAIEDKKRIVELEEQYRELKTALDSLKSTG